MRAPARELLIDRTIHVTGLIAASIGGVALLASVGNAADYVASTLYVSSLLAVLIFSTLNNWELARGSRELFRRLDHAAIFLLIAGTYSPFMTALTGDPRAAALFAFVWTAAISGFLLKLFRPDCLGRFWPLFYLAVGWSGALILGLLIDQLPPLVLSLILIGGLVYSIGVLFHIRAHLPYQNAIWHGFVIVASAIFFLAVLTFVTAH